MAFVAEPDLARFEQPEALDIDVAVGVHEDVVDRRVRQQRLQRPEAGDLVDHLVDQLVQLLRAHRAVLARQEALHEPQDLAAQILLPDLVDHREVQPLEQLVMQAALQLQPFHEAAVGGRVPARRQLAQGGRDGQGHDLGLRLADFLVELAKHLSALLPAVPQPAVCGLPS